MQMGLNTDIQRQGKTIHVQTEDVTTPTHYVITHLFLAGSIIASEQRDYEEGMSADDVKTLVRAQHQEMIRAALSGRYDRALLLHRPRASSRGKLPRARRPTPTRDETSSPNLSLDDEGST